MNSIKNIIKFTTCLLFITGASTASAAQLSYEKTASEACESPGDITVKNIDKLDYCGVFDINDAYKDKAIRLAQDAAYLLVAIALDESNRDAYLAAFQKDHSKQVSDKTNKATARGIVARGHAFALARNSTLEVDLNNIVNTIILPKLYSGPTPSLAENKGDAGAGLGHSAAGWLLGVSRNPSLAPNITGVYNSAKSVFTNTTSSEGMDQALGIGLVYEALLGGFARNPSLDAILTAQVDQAVLDISDVNGPDNNIPMQGIGHIIAGQLIALARNPSLADALQTKANTGMCLILDLHYDSSSEDAHTAKKMIKNAYQAAIIRNPALTTDLSTLQSQGLAIVEDPEAFNMASCS